MTTFTRVQAAAACETSNRSISNWLNAFESIHGLDGILENNQITELGLERLKERAAIGAAAYREKYEPTEIEAEVITETDTAAAGSLTLASTCQTIADRTGTIALTSSEPYEQRAAAARSALAQFVQTNNERGQRLAQNAATTRRSFEQLGTEHAIGHLMTYAEALNATLAEGMAAMQTGAVSMADRMGNAAAESVS
jgi:predicted TIM-barrel fold metal-dependent hydrolase